MKHWFSLILVVGLFLSGSVVVAQEQLTETYKDSWMSFQYPDGWQVELDFNGDPQVTNAPLKDSNIFFTEPGKVRILILALDESVNSSQVRVAEKLTDAEFALYIASAYAGVMMSTYQFGAGPDEWPDVELTKIEKATVNGREGYLVGLKMTTGDRGVSGLIIASRGTGVIMAFASLNEMDQWQDTVMGIAQTVELRK